MRVSSKPEARIPFFPRELRATQLGFSSEELPPTADLPAQERVLFLFARFVTLAFKASETSDRVRSNPNSTIDHRGLKRKPNPTGEGKERSNKPPSPTLSTAPFAKNSIIGKSCRFIRRRPAGRKCGQCVNSSSFLPYVATVERSPTVSPS